MDNVTLKKKLSTYLSEGGRLKNVSEDLLCEVLRSWEEWPGAAKEFYKSIGFSHKQMAKLIGKAKKLKRDGHFGSEAFKEIKLEEADVAASSDSIGSCHLIELQWQPGKVIRFPQVKQLLEFLQKAG